MRTAPPALRLRSTLRCRPALRCRAALAARPLPRSDQGFTLVEVIVSVMLIGIVMTGLTSFFVTTLAVNGQQSGKQAAVRLADDGAERVRAIKGSAVTTGRDQTSSTTQWGSPVVGVAAYLTDMQMAWDASAAFPAGASAPLPTEPRASTVSGVAYNQYWYVGRCWQPAAGGDCTATQALGSVEFFRVVVAVLWRNAHCTGTTCSYVTSTLVSTAFTEPAFQPAAPPTVNNPGAQVGEVSVAASLQVTASGGAAPMTWSAAGLPAGLSMDSSGLITGTPTTAEVATVTATVTDASGRSASATFTWTIAVGLQLANPGTQTSAWFQSLSLVIPRSGGTGAMTWSATGLHSGLGINTSTGVISGTPWSLGTRSVTVTVQDANNRTASVTFDWRVQLFQVLDPGDQDGHVNSSIDTVQLNAVLGSGSYTWTVVNLPPGLSMTSGGRITGRPDEGTRYLVTATATDTATGERHSLTFAWNITSNSGSVRIAAPTGDRTGDLVGQSVTITGSANGGGGTGYTWAASGLPPGTSISSAGVITGTLTTTGVYTVTLTATASTGKVGTFMFTWTIL